MARVKELTFGMGRTVNTGNYENVRVELAETLELEPGDNEQVVFAELVKRIGARVGALAEAVLAQGEERRRG